MIIQIEIADDLVPSLQQYLDVMHTVHSTDEVTKQIVVTKKFAGPADYLLSVVDNAVQDALQRFPTASMREKIIALKQLEEQMKQSVRPTIVRTPVSK